ncbi:MAG: cupin domain-containing protein [Pseudomonadota bacterium]
MQINADFTKRAVVHAAEEPWVASPMPGVERRMLDRIGDEVARATTIVRFAPGSAFSAHTHDGGEEYLVLEGVFQDDDGDFPVGTYVRNPPTSAHTPASQDGCVILVKLHQFDPDDRTQIRVDTVAADPVEAEGRPGVQTVPLHTDARETVRIEHWAPGAEVTLPVPGGLEAFVLNGGFEEGGEQFARHSWLRLPEGATLSARAGTDGARLWVKTGHLTGA